MFKTGDRVSVPDPDGPGRRISATFQQAAVGDEQPKTGPSLAWITYEEGERHGTTDRLPFSEIRRR